MNEKIIIRTGNLNDLSAVHNLVRELAIYEKEPEAVATTPEEYVTDFESGLFEIIVAEKNNEVVGMCLFFMAYSTWKGKMIYLDDFVVDPQLRGQGIGKLLFDQLIKICKNRGVRLMKWQVLDWNKPALNFYEKYNAEIEKEWWNGKIVF